MKALVAPPVRPAARKHVPLEARLDPDFNLEEDSPELEAALLKAVRGPHKPFSAAGLRKIADRALLKYKLAQAK
jgi:hypothetical protein